MAIRSVLPRSVAPSTTPASAAGEAGPLKWFARYSVKSQHIAHRTVLNWPRRLDSQRPSVSPHLRPA